MYKNILVGVDLTHTEKAGAMLKAAQSFGKDAQITLINVIEDIPTYVAAELPKGMVAEMKEKANSELSALAKSFGTSANVEIASGRPANALLDKAKALGSDLIIIASHQPGVQDYLLGSTASRVVRHAHCSVLVMR